MKTFQITLIAGALSLGQAWAADDVGVPSMPTELHNQDQLMQILETMSTGEIEQAEFALQHATHADIKSVAQQLVDDHTRSNLNIQELRRADTEPQPSELSEQLQVQSAERMEALTNLDAAKFDCVFLSNQLDQHELAINLVSRQLESSDVVTVPVLSFLENTLTELEHHSQSLNALLAQSICQDVSAAANP